MPQIVEFFLKTDPGDEKQSTTPPFILHFGLEKAQIDPVRRQAVEVIKGLQRQRPFANASHAVQYTLANSIFTNELANPDARQVLSILLVYLATDSAEKQQALASGATRMGFLLATSPQALANTPEHVASANSPDTVIKGLLQTGISPFRFRFVALLPA